MPIHLGTQYYRPPFPRTQFHADDLSAIAASGMDTVQLWAVWAWMEPEPRTFRFEEYDALFEKAEDLGLKVVVSLIADLFPYWFHSVVPDAHLVDHTGRKIDSCNRAECNFGLTPGGNFDDPRVWSLMEAFITAVVERYRGRDCLLGWDVWNECRWNYHADGLVCYSKTTVDRFCQWLKDRYKTLDAINEAWHRRYRCWEEILPGTKPGRPYTEVMAFEEFISARSSEHGKQRYRLVKALDPAHAALLHGAWTTPLPIYFGDEGNHHALNRGNDWEMVEELDGLGSSFFPVCLGFDDAEYSYRLNFTRSAAGEKLFWVSELQGGAAGNHFMAGEPLSGARQQSWIWEAISQGVKTVILWAWRDEVFGGESSGFGFCGNDGLYEDRRAAMLTTSSLLREHEVFFDRYRPVQPEVAVLFSPGSHFLHWAAQGDTTQPRDALRGYARGLTQLSLPFDLLEENHLPDLSRYKWIIAPRLEVTAPEMERMLLDYVRGGGVLWLESESGAFDPNGFYRYPQSRGWNEAFCFHESGRRPLPEDKMLHLQWDLEQFNLPMSQWVTPLRGVSGQNLTVGQTEPTAAIGSLGQGEVVYFGSYLGDAQALDTSPDFLRLLAKGAKQAGVHSPVRTVDWLGGAQQGWLFTSGQSNGQQFIHARFPQHVKGGEMFLQNRADCLLDIRTGVRFFPQDSEGHVFLLTPNEWNSCLLMQV